MSQTIALLKQEYDALTEINDHTGAAKLIVDAFGTFDDKLSMDVIANNHERRGYITAMEKESRDQIVGKWMPFFNYLK